MRYIHSIIKLVIRNSHFDLYYLYSSTRITQLRNGTYQARVYIKGNDKPIYASSKRLEEVKQKREKILEQYNLGLQTDASKKTLNDWFDEWMELYVVGKVKPRTVQNYIREYETYKSKSITTDIYPKNGKRII